MASKVTGNQSLQLPNEIKQEVIKYLSTHEAISLRSVCRDFRDQLEENALWKHFCRRDFGILTNSENAKSVYQTAFQQRKSIEKGRFIESFDLEGSKCFLRSVYLYDPYLIIDDTYRNFIILEPSDNLCLKRVRYQEEGRTDRKALFSSDRSYFIHETGDQVVFAQRDGDQFLTVHRFDRDISVSMFPLEVVCFHNQTLYMVSQLRKISIIKGNPDPENKNKLVFGARSLLPVTFDDDIQKIRCEGDYLCVQTHQSLTLLKISENYKQVAVFDADPDQSIFNFRFFGNKCYLTMALFDQPINTWTKEKGKEDFKKDSEPVPFDAFVEHQQTDSSYVFTLVKPYDGILQIRDGTKSDLPLIQSFKVKAPMAGEFEDGIASVCNYKNYLITYSYDGTVHFFLKEGYRPGFQETPFKSFHFPNSGSRSSLNILGDTLIVNSGYDSNKIYSLNLR